MRFIFLNLVLLPVILLVTGCDLRTYPDDYIDDDDNVSRTADSVIITYAPTTVIGLDSLAIEIIAFTWRDGEPQPDLRACWRVRQQDEAGGYFVNPSVESTNNPPGRVSGLFVSDLSPSGHLWLIAEATAGYGGDSVSVMLHKRPLLTLPPDTSMTDTTVDIVLSVSLRDDRLNPLAQQSLNFSVFPPYGSVTGLVQTNHNGEAEISFDAEGYSGSFIIDGWLLQFEHDVRDTMLVEVEETVP
ncbi:MAG: hypothetical protein ISR91_03025 [Candidatus Delongbacteria bacterium]|nr:hypothetical protein [bacterium]MBL7033094.1 hypothetical protein [Candidatus Delongbacteria bacterium]